MPTVPNVHCLFDVHLSHSLHLNRVQICCNCCYSHSIALIRTLYRNWLLAASLAGDFLRLRIPGLIPSTSEHSSQLQRLLRSLAPPGPASSSALLSAPQPHFRLRSKPLSPRALPEAPAPLWLHSDHFSLLTPNGSSPAHSLLSRVPPNNAPPGLGSPARAPDR